MRIGQRDLCGRKAGHRPCAGGAAGGDGADAMTSFRAGLMVLLAGVAFVWYAFARPHPLRHQFELRAVFSSVTGLRPGLSPVRIAGVEVGRVSAVESFRGTRSALVTMQLDDNGLPLHVDATVKLRP